MDHLRERAGVDRAAVACRSKVHEDDLAGHEVVEHAAFRTGDGLQSQPHPTPGVHRPAHRCIAEPPHDPECPRIARAVREAEERTRIAPRRAHDHPFGLRDLTCCGRSRQAPQVEMVDGVVRDRIPPADRPRQERIRLDEVSREEERPSHVLLSQNCENPFCCVRVAATVEGQRDDVLSRL